METFINNCFHNLAPGYVFFVWLGLVVVFSVIEAATAGLTSIWFAVAALVAMLVSFIGFSIGVQIVVFIVVSIILLVVARNWAINKFNVSGEKTNVNALVGKKIKINETVDNLKETGRTEVEGITWMVRSEDPDVVIEAGETAVIRSVSGVKLIVIPFERKDNIKCQ